MKIVGLGACVLDTLISCGKYPTEDTKQKAENIFLSGGGPVGNALVVASKLGVTTSVIGNFADDNAGKYLLEDFNKYGVSTKGATIIKGCSSFTSYILLNEEQKSRTCVFDRGSVPDDYRLVNYSEIDDADILHLDGNYMNCAIFGAKYAKQKGKLVSLDAGGLYSGIEELLPYIDILIPSGEFALGITKQNTIIDAMRVLKEKYNPKILVVTDGKNGGYYYDNNEIKHYDSIKVNAVDTNGAGDTFHGAFLSAYLDGKDILDCCNFASIVAGYKCANKGARTYPLSKEIIENLKF